jgi:hypothetical protein
MELNLDDEYYQKYIKYKQRYTMLKQLKNNIELEGGGQKWWTDYYIYPNPETVEDPILYPTETFLVFNNEFATYEELKMFSKFVFKSVDNDVIKKGDYKDDPNEQNIQEDDDKKILMTLEEFYDKFTYGYIVEKNGTEYQFKLYDKDKKTTLYNYKTIDDYLKNLKNNFTLEHYGDTKPEKGNINDLELYNLIVAKTTKYTEDSRNFFETNIEENIENDIRKSKAMKTLLEYSFQKMKGFNEQILDSSNNTLFLSKLTAEIKKDEKPLNMLIKIDVNQFNVNEKIYFIESEANNTSTYLNIQTIINEYRKAKKTKDDSKLPAKT